MTQRGPVPVGAPQRPGLGAAKLGAEESSQQRAGLPPHRPLGAWKAACLFLAVLQPSGGRGLVAPSAAPAPAPGAGNKSGRISPLGTQPSQLFPTASL